MKVRVGFHMMLKGGYGKQLKSAASIGADTVQIFSGNPTSWKPPKMNEAEAVDFIKKQKENYIYPLIFHTPYLINLASPKEDIYTKSIELLKSSIQRASLFKASYVITHIGSHLGEGQEKGLTNICKAVEQILPDWPEDVILLLENTSGSGNNVGSSFEEIGTILKKFTDSNFKNRFLGFCFDTAHAYGAGYDLSSASGVDKTMEELEEYIELELLKVIHANDTLVELGSKKDKHEDLFKGNIGKEGFRILFGRPELRHVESIILETPKRTETSDEENLSRLKEVVAG